MRKLTPQEKKRREYERDHYVHAEYPHAFRKAWPRKKAHANRAFRRKAERLVRELEHGTAAEVVERAEHGGATAGRIQHSVSRKRLRKSGIQTLRERVARTSVRRVERAGQNRFFRKAYSTEDHREAFVRFLEALLGARTPFTRQVALHFAAVLGPDAPHRPSLRREREWLETFFRDEPAWEGRIRCWTSEVVPAPGCGGGTEAPGGPGRRRIARTPGSPRQAHE